MNKIPRKKGSQEEDELKRQIKEHTNRKPDEVKIKNKKMSEKRTRKKA